MKEFGKIDNGFSFCYSKYQSVGGLNGFQCNY
jgi:hypothetical protein